MARKSSAERAKILAGGFASARKNIVIQYEGRERTEQHLLDMIRDDAMKQGIADEDIVELDVYIKPEEHTVFYVVNKDIEGQVAF